MNLQQHSVYGSGISLQLKEIMYILSSYNLSTKFKSTRNNKMLLQSQKNNPTTLWHKTAESYNHLINANILLLLPIATE